MDPEQPDQPHDVGSAWDVAMRQASLAEAVEQVPVELRSLIESMAIELTGAIGRPDTWGKSTDGAKDAMRAGAADLLRRAHARARGDAAP